jgi:hypothetical protein
MAFYEIVEVLPKLGHCVARGDSPERLTALKTDGWLKQEKPLTAREKAVLEARRLWLIKMILRQAAREMS